MRFCTKCGKQLNEGNQFCGYCGFKVKNEEPLISPAPVYTGTPVITQKKNASNDFFRSFYVNYHSLCFKWAMIVFLALSCNKIIFEIYSFLTKRVLPDLVLPSLGFRGSDTVWELAVTTILIGVFAFLILKRKTKKTVRKSCFLSTLWLSAVILNIAAFILSCIASGLGSFILYGDIVEILLRILLVISTCLLFHKNKPKTPLALIAAVVVITLMFVDGYQFQTVHYNPWALEALFGETLVFDLISVFLECLYLPFLACLLFLIRYFIPDKVSKWIVFIPATAVSIWYCVDYLSYIQFILDLFQELGVIIMLVLFALSCKKENVYDFEIEERYDKKRYIIKAGVISTVVSFVLILSGLLISNIVCASYINKSISLWKPMIVNGDVLSEENWSKFDSAFSKYSTFSVPPSLIDDYAFYNIINDWDTKHDIKTVSDCYNAYKKGYVSEEIQNDYLSLSYKVEDWENSRILSGYYKKYIEMKPKKDRVYVSSNTNASEEKTTITVRNENVMPIDVCEVDLKFTILYISLDSYSSPEFVNGRKTIFVDKILGKSSKTDTFDFDPDDFHKSYRSYFYASIRDESASVTSIS